LYTWYSVRRIATTKRRGTTRKDALKRALANLDSTGVGKYMEKLTGDGRQLTYNTSDAAKHCDTRRR
jgi:hypothetical protein